MTGWLGGTGSSGGRGGRIGWCYSKKGGWTVLYHPRLRSPCRSSEDTVTPKNGGEGKEKTMSVRKRR